MKPISVEKREMIVSARKRGEKPGTIAVWVGVNRSSVYNILALHRKTNDITPKPYPGRKSRLTAEHYKKIRTIVGEKNDITLEEMIDELHLPIKKSRLSEILIEMNFSFKKRCFIQTGSNGKGIRKTRKMEPGTRRFRHR